MRNEIDPLALLADVLACVELGRPADRLTRWWLRNGVRQYLAQDSRQSLDTALGLARRGKDSPGRRVRIALRNQLIADAAAAVALDQAVNTWERCKRLQPLAARINALSGSAASKAWPLPDWPAAQRYLYEAASVMAPLPASAQGLADAVKRNDLFCLDKDAERLLVRFF